MSGADQTMEQDGLLVELEQLVARQERMLKNNRLRGFEAAVEKAGPLWEAAEAAELPRHPRYRQRFQALVERGQRIALMVEVEKDQTRRQLQKLTSGKKTIRAYQQKR